jgi:class 3 adenylate cyclase
MGAPQTLYAEGMDGSQIAYQVVGEGPLDLVYLSGSTSHVDVRWELPIFARFHERLASFARLIVFDRRGTGASDPAALDALPTWEEWADDLRVVMDAADSDRAAVFGVLDAGPMALLFAATHPHRTRALVVGNTGARLVATADHPEGLDREAADSFLQLVQQQWGTESFAAIASPTLANDPHARSWFAKYMRASASPRAAAIQFRSLFELDLGDVLGSIQVPTLVLHRREFVFAPVAQARYLADHIPDARLVLLEGGDSALAFGDAESALEAVEEFLTGLRRPHETDRVLATVLFTDLLDSTGRAAQLGDRRWRDLLDEHDAVAHREVKQYRGRIIKTTGDGILATFDAPGRAIRCTLGLRRALERLGLEMRAGLHAGEIELRDDDVGGIAVHIGQRVSALASGGELLVSSTVRDLVAGSAIEFTDRGEHSLKGVPGSWRLFSVAG